MLSSLPGLDFSEYGRGRVSNTGRRRNKDVGARHPCGTQAHKSTVNTPGQTTCEHDDTG